jgi:hypothetical protein
MDGIKNLKEGLTNNPFCAIIKVQKREREVIQMAKKNKKKIDRRMLKKEGEELQQWLVFTRRGSKVESGKRYNRQKFKRGDKE